MVALAAPLPVIVAIKALDNTAASAGPPRALPVKEKANSMNNCPAPVFNNKEQNIKKRIRTVDAMYIGSVKIPLVVINIVSILFP